jgi:hypothetical protein
MSRRIDLQKMLIRTLRLPRLLVNIERCVRLWMLLAVYAAGYYASPLFLLGRVRLSVSLPSIATP